MPKRQRIKRQGKSVYATRRKDGTFKDIVNIGKAIHRDSKTKAKRTVKPGYGHLGDLKKKK